MASLSASGGETVSTSAKKGSLLRWITWIWHIRGEVPLPAGQTPDEALAKLDPLFAHARTTHARMGDVVMVTKRDQLAQDPLSIVDSGTLRVDPAEQGAVLRYHLVSRALLYCFLAPLLFLAVGQLTVFLGTLEKPKAEEKAKKDDAKKKDEVTLNPVDKFLGAPAPEKPKDDKKDAKDKKKDGKDGFSPTPAYVFAGIFAALWLIGRLLEPWLIRRLFTRSLAG
ncbi:hypothetical protein [Novosphingobium sp.]|uniref:hypothetical protein n=1 Tax=Novosphingobium sp. TaxID=1874826 RepID=UPI003BAD1F96